MNVIRFKCSNPQCDDYPHKKIDIDTENESHKEKLWTFLKKHSVKGTYGF